MKCFVDTNVIIDYLCHREPFFMSARKLMILGFVRELELWISSTQLSNVIYLLTDGGKASKAEEAKLSLKKLNSFIHTYSTGQREIDALINSAWTDFENALIYEAACKIKADYLVTRNQKGFSRSSIRVFSPDDFFEFIEKNYELFYSEVAL